MGSRDRTYRPGDFSTPASAGTAFAQSIRDSLSYDTLGKVESMHVRVLTRPMPLDLELADSILNAPQQQQDADDATVAAVEAAEAVAQTELAAESVRAVVAEMGDGGGIVDGADLGEAMERQAEAEIEAAQEAAQAAEMEALRAQLASGGGAGGYNGARFYFKGRITMVGLDGSKTMSNFHNLLPDPCNLPITTQPKTIIRILGGYPTFVSSAGYDGQMPMVGETVKVTMIRGDFAQNGQWNEFDTLAEVPIDTGEHTLPSEGECGMLQQLFDFGDMDNNDVDATMGDTTDNPNVYIDPATGLETHVRSRPYPEGTTVDEFPFAVTSQLEYPLGRSIRSTDRNSWQGVELHYTAGWSLNSALRTLRKRGLSYHFIIERNGTINQLVKLKDGAQHGGPGYNTTHIGISYVNVGYTREGGGPDSSASTDDVWYEDDGTTIHNGNRGHTWQPYPAAQKAAGIRLLKNIVSRWPNITADNIITHSIAEPGSKLDTGPALDLAALRTEVFS